MNMRDTSQPRTEPDYGDDRPFPNFNDNSLWEASNMELGYVLKEIVEQIAEQLDEGEDPNLEQG
ncbi:hypothetical protein GM921_00655 [Pedobacter sp. LMG 31464]|uniref:Uncharacterized protein n=1 Tax=Pedobacter planticolens TaxID=2679964 RepID=A0A923DVU3_9SPHI|nr:hypothetical protein [Pedobacter planticolens]MBB2143980.1 hypothetical protein [Pedobacter planticolens]